MDLLRARYILSEQIRRNIKVVQPRIEIVDRRFPYIDALFPEQAAFVDDPSKNKCAKCGRRAGKSHVCCCYAIKTCETYPNAQVLYIALTRLSAKRIMWSKIKQLAREYKLDVSFDNSELIVTFRNGSQFFLAGANNASEIEKFRGSAFDLVIIDESASFADYLTELVEDVLEPTLIDKDGSLCEIGTPNARCSGHFHDITNGIQAGWATHEWTILNNPYIPHAREWLEKRIASKGWSWDHPVVQREWLGKWVRSLDSLVYRFSEARNVCAKTWAPENYIIGVDLGYDDATAFVVWGFTEHSPKVRAVDSFKRVGMLPSHVALELKTFVKKYKPVRIMVDTGGLGKAIVEEMRIRYQLSLHSAEKQHKGDFIEIMNSDFDSGIIEIDPKLKDYVAELSILQWDEDRRKEDPRYENHLCDAGLYGYREAKHWTYTKPEPEPAKDTDAYMDQMWDQQAQELERQKREEQEWGNDDLEFL
jgi:hypothetical protein